MSEHEKEVAARIHFDVAEVMILGDHLTKVRDDAAILKQAIEDSKGFEAMQAWNRLGDHMNYIGTLLNLKGSSAARQYIEDKGLE